MVEKYEDPFVRIASMIGGDEYLKIARSLLKVEDATDEEIASSTGLRINLVRKILYDLFGKSLITGMSLGEIVKGWFADFSASPSITNLPLFCGTILIRAPDFCQKKIPPLVYQQQIARALISECG